MGAVLMGAVLMSAVLMGPHASLGMKAIQAG
jgi:hypothetical protein